MVVSASLRVCNRVTRTSPIDLQRCASCERGLGLSGFVITFGGSPKASASIESLLPTTFYPYSRRRVSRHGSHPGGDPGLFDFTRQQRKRLEEVRPCSRQAVFSWRSQAIHLPFSSCRYCYLPTSQKHLRKLWWEDRDTFEKLSIC